MMTNVVDREAKYEFAQGPLRWSGYSQPSRVTLNHMAAEYAEPFPLYNRIPYCAESYRILQAMEPAKRIELEERLLAGIDHSTNLTPYVGIIDKSQSQFIQEQLKNCTMTMMQLMKILAKDNVDGPEISKICASMPSEQSNRFLSVLRTSCHNYTQFNGRDVFANNLEQAFYLESAIDIMSNGQDLMLAEFQVRYSAPYPHLLENLNNACQQNFPELFAMHNLKTDSFPARRLKMIQDLYDSFAQKCGSAPDKLVIDGWAYLQNSGANWQALARQLDAQYLVFDDMTRGGKNTASTRKQFVFNQVPVHQLDPSDSFYSCINDERMENYDELGWDGLNARYLAGDVCFVHPPITDIANDKALYDFLPELCRILLGCDLSLPVIKSRPCWKADSPSEIDDETIVWALQNKDKCVITHRYLEGGSGIRIGASMSAEEWNTFIGGYVLSRPYLYLIRDYFPMDPDISIRVLSSSLSDSMSVEAPIDFACSETYLLRYSAQKPLTLKNSRCLLLLPSGN